MDIFEEWGGVTGLESKIKRGRGRPRKEGSYNRTLKFCASDDHEYMGKSLEDELDKNRSEVLREALETLYRFKIKLKGD